MQTSQRTLNLTYCALGAALMAVCAMISIPAAVPYTLQTFALYFLIRFLGGAGTIKALAVYVLMGLIGLPVFSGLRGGAGVLFGATGGYIIGFFFPALCAWLWEKWLHQKKAAFYAAAMLGLLLCYAFGTGWFLIVYARGAAPMALSKALGLCVTPFILPDLVKAALGIALGARLKGILRPASSDKPAAERRPVNK